MSVLGKVLRLNKSEHWTKYSKLSTKFNKHPVLDHFPTEQPQEPTQDKTEYNKKYRELNKERKIELQKIHRDDNRHKLNRSRIIRNIHNGFTHAPSMKSIHKYQLIKTENNTWL